jgi:hypothetical protein
MEEEPLPEFYFLATPKGLLLVCERTNEPLPNLAVDVAMTMERFNLDPDQVRFMTCLRCPHRLDCPYSQRPPPPPKKKYRGDEPTPAR